MNKKYILLTSVALVVVWAIFVLLPSSKEKDKKDEVPVEENSKVEQEKEPEFITENEQNDLIVEAFIRELMGNDFEFLLQLFMSDKLPKNIDEMNEAEYDKYAIEIGSAIKLNKELSKGKIMKIKRIDQHSSEYTINLVFKDGVVKVIHLTVVEDKIVTPLAELL